ncbi:MAG: prepilin peptidase [Lachnospiraceae bacterium]|nr:prepilin peptidase [Lachnospiraceae bacterium]
MTYTTVLAILTTLLGIVVGSFLNVCIYRIPKKEDIVFGRSHCMNCGYVLKWYDLIPVVSWLVLKGHCRKCNTRISVQYPLIEVLNGILYLSVFLRYGAGVETLLFCLMVSALLALSVIDLRTYEIPVGFNYFIFALGLVRIISDRQNWSLYVFGFFSVSLPLFLIYVLTKGRGIGGGDIKLMAAAGLVLGWKLAVLGFFFGCIAGSVIHLIRMKVSKASHVLAMGPYLSLGLYLSMIFGSSFLSWYLGRF